jgi:hypothetical protein
MRKPIQLMAHGVDEDGMALLALCDDGTVWVYEGLQDQGNWVQMPNIPQDPMHMPEGSGNPSRMN